MERITMLLLMTMAAALVMASGVAWAANAGDLDTSFDGDGRVVFDVFGGVDDEAQAVAVQPDGKIVLAGSWCGFGAQCNTGTFALARFNPDGSLDKTFGSGGRVLVTFPNGRAKATGVAIQADGKIVASGWRDDDDGVNDADFALVRLEPDGDLDPSLSEDGKVMTTFGGSDRGNAVAIQSSGKIVVAGDTTGCGDIDFALARYNPNGTLDTTFSGDGKVCTGFGEWEWAEAVALQTDGEIVAAGTSYDSFPCGFDGCYRDFAVARYNPNGTLDTTFSGDGKVLTGLGGDDFAFGLAIQGDDRIVVAGENGHDFALARYNPNGSLDGSFGGGGKISTDFGGYDSARGIALQTDGKIVVAGENFSSDNGNFALARYNTDGSPSSSFSGDGKLTTGFGGDDDLAHGVAIQADGRIVAAGYTNVGGDRDFALARYHAITDNTPPNTTITGGPSGPTNSTSATFAFVSSEAGSRFQCSLDGAPFSTCSSPKSYPDLTDGSHIFSVRAIDAAGNVDQTPAQRSFTVDTKAPKVINVLPTEGASGVAPGVNVQATFSEAMSASSITTDTIKLFRAGTTTPIAAAVSYEAQMATLNPENDLRLGTKYKAVVSTGTRDLAGNRLDQDQDPANGNQPMVWRFTIRN